MMLKLPNIPFTIAKIDTAGSYQIPKHLEYLQSVLIDVYHGKIKRLIVNMPPRHGKSELITHYFPVWYLCNRPNTEIRVFAADDSLAEKFGNQVRDTFQNISKLYNLSISKTVSSMHRFQITGYRKGIFSAYSIGAKFVGQGGDVIIIDDPIATPEEADSITRRDKIYQYYLASIYTRRSPNAAIILVMTRWNYDDLAGRIMANSKEDWTVINLPAICNSEDDLLGRTLGEALWPERWNIDLLNVAKSEMGSSMFSALYQGEPIANEDIIFHPEYWNKYNYEILNPDLVIVSWDTAIKTEERNDYTVATVWKIKDSKLYLDDMYRAKLDFPSMLSLYEKIHNKYPNIDIDLIEDKASGSQLIQTVKLIANNSIKAIEPKGSKITRAHLATPIFEQGKVHIRDSEWTDTVINECAKFPRDKHDDLVDSITQMINYSRPYIYESGENSLLKDFFAVNNIDKSFYNKF